MFDILMTITQELNTITGQMTPFFHLLFELYPLVYLRRSKFSSMESLSPFPLCSGLQNTYLHAKDDIFKSVNIDGKNIR